MSLKYCIMCERPVEPKRKIGIGTLLLVLLTSGFWLLTIPFYQKRCPICTGSSLLDPKEMAAMKRAQSERSSPF
ncbi:hypothetical protein OKW39_000708 [Paraburkholderia sp. MM6662-R1]